MRASKVFLFIFLFVFSGCVFAGTAEEAINKSAETEKGLVAIITAEKTLYSNLSNSIIYEAFVLFQMDYYKSIFNLLDKYPLPSSEILSAVN